MIKPQLFGPVIFFIGVAFGLLETWYFGWNWLPINYTAFACDALAMFLMSCGFLMAAISYINRLISL